jgi:hypothetical protein
MAKYTLLSIIQKTLTYMDDENVNDINETQESEMLVDIVNQVYHDIVMSFPWADKREIGSLETTATDHIMKLPTTVLGIDWIRYNDKDLEYVLPLDMEKKLSGRDQTLTNVDSNGAINDQDPAWWTSNDDFNIIFDAYDGSLLGANSRCSFVTTIQDLTEDTDIPDLPERFHPTLVWGVVAEALRIFKGDLTQANVYEVKYQRGLSKMKRWARRINLKTTTQPNDFGRRNVAAQRSVRIIDGST